jgi:hypothetical protein
VFRDGGVPARDGELDTLFGDKLAAWQRDHAEAIRFCISFADECVTASANEMSSLALHDDRHHIGTEWQELLAAVDWWDFDRGPRASDKIDARARELNAALHARGLGYYIGVDYEELIPRLTGYRVERVDVLVTEIPARDTRRIVLAVRRLAGWADSIEFWGTAYEEGAVVYVDAIERSVVTELLPALVPDGAFPASAKTELGKRVAAALGPTIRAEMVAVLGPAEMARAARVGALLAERATLLSPELRAHVAGQLFLDPFTLAELGAGPGARAKAIDAELAREGAAELTRRVAELIAEVARRHEIQHAIDRDVKPTTPEKLAAAIANQPVQLPLATTELSAYLSQLTVPRLVHFGLWVIASHALTEPSSERGPTLSLPQSQMAAVLLESVAAELGIATEPLLIAGGPDRERVARLLFAVMAKPSPDISAAAKRAYANLFGRAVSRIGT